MKVKENLEQGKKTTRQEKIAGRKVEKAQTRYFPESLPETLQDVLKIIIEKKAEDIVIIDLRNFNHISDFFVVCTASSSTHRKAIVDEIEEKINGEKILSVDFNPSSGWNVVDCGDFILHIFEEEQRKFYDIEGLWADARHIKVDLPHTPHND